MHQTSNEGQCCQQPTGTLR